jgi:hypothetical protein
MLRDEKRFGRTSHHGTGLRLLSAASLLRLTSEQSLPTREKAARRLAEPAVILGGQIR